MASSRRIVGFDRKIQLEWLDATADWTAEGIAPPELRERLSQLLEGQVSGSGYRGAREKTITVLTHIWVAVSDDIAPLRGEALALLENRSGQARLPLHWGMTVSTYSFFNDVAGMTGRLLRLQGTVALSQITRRMAEAWGDRGIVIRATRHVVRSFVLWGVLEETRQPGVFSAAAQIEVGNGDEVGSWLVQAIASEPSYRPLPLSSLLRSPVLFPFQLTISPRDMANHPRLELRRQGLDEEVVVRRHV